MEAGVEGAVHCCPLPEWTCQDVPGASPKARVGRGVPVAAWRNKTYLVDPRLFRDCHWPTGLANR